MSYQFFRNSLINIKTGKKFVKKQTFEVGSKVVIKGVLDDNSLALTITENPNNDELDLIHGIVTPLTVSMEAPSSDILTTVKRMFKCELYIFQTFAYSGEPVFVLFIKRSLKDFEIKEIKTQKNLQK